MVLSKSAPPLFSRWRDPPKLQPRLRVGYRKSKVPIWRTDGAERLAGRRGGLGHSYRALGRAVIALEQRITARASAYDAQEDDLFESDRARLAAELDAARARERALEEVAAEASAALGRAAAEVRAALSAEEH